MISVTNARKWYSAILLFLVLTGCDYFTQYYVSPSGSDAVGDGSQLSPWKTINYALNNINYSQAIPILNVAPGAYDEKITISNAIIINGAGSDQVTVQNSQAGDSDFVITVNGSILNTVGNIFVMLKGMKVDGRIKNRGVKGIQTMLLMDDVNVFQPGGFGIVIAENCFFNISNCTVGTIGYAGWSYSDIGIDVGNYSTGTITNFSGGDHIDHIINIRPGCNVTISDSVLQGSPIWYADGIRIQGASNVSIINTSIIRPPDSELPPEGEVNPFYCGIEAGSSSDGHALVMVKNCTINGFDVGIGINMMWNEISVQDCTISGNISADVKTIWHGYGPAVYPVVDLGGGDLGSPGGNDFGMGDEYAVVLEGPYDVFARYNNWGVIGITIEDRIIDRLDNPLLGRVYYSLD